MGLWLKQDDGSLVEVSGGGGGGSFDGEHVLTGDPSDPAVVESVAEGQLLYDGVESDGSGGGPHDHDEYLPLEGGVVTGDLRVDGTIEGAIANHPTKVGFRSGFVTQNTNASGEISVTYSPALTYANAVPQITPFSTSGTAINHVQIKASSQWGFTVTCWANGSRVNNANAQFFWLVVEYE